MRSFCQQFSLPSKQCQDYLLHDEERANATLLLQHMLVAWNGDVFEKDHAWPFGIRAIQRVDTSKYSARLQERQEEKGFCISIWGAYEEFELFVDTSLKDKGILQCSVKPTQSVVETTASLQKVERDLAQKSATRLLQKHKTFTLLVFIDFTHEDFRKTFQNRRQTMPKLAAVAYSIFLQVLDYVGSKKHNKSQANNQKSYAEFLKQSEEVADNMPAIWRKERKDVKTLIAEGKIALPPAEPREEDSAFLTPPFSSLAIDPSASQSSLVTENSSTYVSAVEELSDEEDTIIGRRSSEESDAVVSDHVLEKQEDKPIYKEQACSHTSQEYTSTTAEDLQVQFLFASSISESSKDDLEDAVDAAEETANMDTSDKVDLSAANLLHMSHTQQLESVSQTVPRLNELECMGTAASNSDTRTESSMHNTLLDDAAFPSLAASKKSQLPAEHTVETRRFSYAQAVTGLTTIPEESPDPVTPTTDREAQFATPPEIVDADSLEELNHALSESSFSSSGSTVVIPSRSPTPSFTSSATAQDRALPQRRPFLSRSATAMTDPTPHSYHRNSNQADRTAVKRFSPPYASRNSSLSPTHSGHSRKQDRPRQGQLCSKLLAQPIAFSYEQPHKITDCLEPTCQSATNSRKSVICPRCGPLSLNRYCSRGHLLGDVRRHFAQGGECLRRPNHLAYIDEQFFIHSELSRPFIQVSNPMYDSLERHRQAIYRSYPLYDATVADYFIFNDADLISVAMASGTNFSLELLQVYRGKGTVAAYVQFPARSQPAKKAMFSKLLEKLLWLGTGAGLSVAAECRALFLSIKDNLENRGLWDVQMADRVIFAMKMEFMYSVEKGDRD